MRCLHRICDPKFRHSHRVVCASPLNNRCPRRLPDFVEFLRFPSIDENVEDLHSPDVQGHREGALPWLRQILLRAETIDNPRKELFHDFRRRVAERQDSLVFNVGFRFNCAPCQHLVLAY